MNSPKKLDQKSLPSSSSNILSFSSSTPSTINDPNDEIWFEFLNSLNQQTQNEPLTENNLEKPCGSDSKVSEDGQTADNDDAADDPDFTVCLENFDLEDPYYPDACFQVPKKEAVELVKDAIEICDGAPIVYDDQRHSKIKSAITIKKLTTENRTKILINRVCKLGGSLEPKSNRIQKPPPVPLPSKEFVPEFTETQREQLDEQLRNHVQLLTQACLVTYCSKENGHVFDEAHNLLNILKGLNKNDDKINEEEDNVTASESKMVKLSNFDIVNLDEALDIISDVKKMTNEELSMDLKQGIPSKFLEIFLKSPVFYNTSLIPNLSKFKFQSQFKRAQFTETEKILLIMGFNKFKHLPKSECCECIKEHLLPIRSCDDIRKQLNNFSSSEQRQNQLKELLKRQRQIKTNSMQNYHFIKEVHYKSPFDQADSVQLPSQYTIIMERIKLANVLKDSKKSLKEKPADNDKENEQSTRSHSILSQHIKNIEPIGIEELGAKSSKPIEIAKVNQIQKIRPQLTKIAGKRDRSKSPRADNECGESLNLEDTDIIVLDEETGNTDTSSIAAPIRESRQTEQNNQAPIVINPEQNKTSNVGNSLPASFILPASNLANLFSGPISVINPSFVKPMGQNFPIIHQFPMMPQSPPVILPANFSGTVLYQPTIHIHTSSKNANMNKFCKIKPKETSADNSPAKKKKN